MNATNPNGQRFIRRVNNAVYDVLVKLRVEDGEFWCECSDPACDERVSLTLREYAALRHHGEYLLSRRHAEAAPADLTSDRLREAPLGVPLPEPPVSAAQ